MDKLRIIIGFARAIATGFLPPGLKPMASLVGHGIDQIYAQIDAERERQGLTWQEIEAQLTSEMPAEQKNWADFLKRLESSVS